MTDIVESRPIERAHIVAVTRSWIGTPYHHQASKKGIGCDCLGLVRGVWRDLYNTEPERPPPYSADWAEASRRETLIESAERHLRRIDPADATAGDILVFRWRARHPAKHVGILAHRTRLVHAIERIRVTEIKLSPWWWRRCAAAFAFPNVEPPPVAPLWLVSQ